MRKYLFKVVVLLMIIIYSSLDGQVFYREDFTGIAHWEALFYSNIPDHSNYTIVTKPNQGSYLKAVADHSASALVLKKKFNVFKYPVLRWRWKIEHVIPGGNAKAKTGDDYPLRIYVLFQYDENESGILESTLFNSLKLLYRESPPHSSLVYIWANQEFREDILPSPYTRREEMILVEKGVSRTGEWVEETVNILNDYQRAFGEKPPRMASLAIMSDTDDTGSVARAWLDYLEITKQ
ncbi:MAG: DUF3047 domain-containing protein [Fidelibacterota bacterium]